MLKSVEFHSDIAPWAGLRRLVQYIEGTAPGITAVQIEIIKRMVLAHLAKSFDIASSVVPSTCTVYVSEDCPLAYEFFFAFADSCGGYDLGNGNLWIRPSEWTSKRMVLGFTDADQAVWKTMFNQFLAAHGLHAQLVWSELLAHGFLVFFDRAANRTYRIEVNSVTLIVP